MLESGNPPKREKLFLLWCRKKIPFGDRKKVAGYLSIFVLLLALILYLGGLLGQFIGNYQEYLQQGGLTSGTLIRLPNAHPLYCLGYAVAAPYGHRGILILFCIAAGIFGYVRLRRSWRQRGMEKDRNFTRSDKGTYGTAGWMTPQDMHKVLEVKPIHETTGTIYGSLINDKNRVVSLPVSTKLNQNTAVYGISGSGKTTAFVLNQILQCIQRGDSIVLTDSKGDLYSATSDYARSRGYTTRLFNLCDPAHSDSWNCLSEIEGDQLRAQTYVSTIMNNTSSGKDDYFWYNAEMNLLKTICLYVVLQKDYGDTEKNMGSVYDFLSFDARKFEFTLEKLPENDPAKRAYNLYKKSAEKVSGNVAMGLGNRLQVFQSDMIRNITSYNEIDLSLPAKERCAYYVVIPDQDRTFDFLSSLFFSFLFIDTIRYADRFSKHRGKCDVPIKIIFDEFNNIGMLPDFQDKISTIRSRLISADIIFQNIPQIKLKYPDDIWQIILGNCDATLFLGCTDPLTSKHISDRSGVASVKVTGQQKWLPTIRLTDYTPTYRQNTSVGKRMFLTPDEIQRLPEDQALLILRGQNMLRLHKYGYWNHPESRKLKPTNINGYLPEWQRYQLEAAKNKPQKVQTEDRPPAAAEPGKNASKRKNTGSHTQTRRKKTQPDENQQSLFIDDNKYESKSPDEI